MNDKTTRSGSDYRRAIPVLGFELAARLASDGWGRVMLACRSSEKGDAARRQALKAKTGKDPFECRGDPRGGDGDRRWGGPGSMMGSRTRSSQC